MGLVISAVNWLMGKETNAEEVDYERRIPPEELFHIAGERVENEEDLNLNVTVIRQALAHYHMYRGLRHFLPFGIERVFDTNNNVHFLIE